MVDAVLEQQTDEIEIARPFRDTENLLGKAFFVLEQVGASDRPPRFVDLLATTRLPKATLHRLLKSLTREGMLAYRHDGRQYSLGPRSLRLAQRGWSGPTLALAARAPLDAALPLGCATLQLATLDNDQVLVVDGRSAAGEGAMPDLVGRHLPVFCTALGTAMLAALPVERRLALLDRVTLTRFTPRTITDRIDLLESIDRCHRQGFACEWEEFETGRMAIALPVLSDRLELFGAVGLAASSHAHGREQLLGLLTSLQTTAQSIARAAEAQRVAAIV